ncbi:MAG TPA: serine hydrolase domain-containing protein [Amaricoccus sp.]|nr:serine hydrolase domain-containing protein [Amaricoccus sp.]
MPCLRLLALVLLGGVAALPARAEDCPTDLIATREGCVAQEDAAARVAEIVNDSIDGRNLKASLAGFAFGDAQPALFAAGETMTGVPAMPDMHFRNGSVAIAYLGTLLLQLVDAGKLDLEDSLATWFPDYPKADQVTLRMLISGTSGYADYVTDAGFLADLHADPFRHWSPEELIAIAFARPMACEPGACWSYAHTNFVILGQVIEKATGRQLADLIRAGIVDRLGLENTRSDVTASIPMPVLHAFDAERGRHEESTFWDPSWTLAHGAIMTTDIADMLRSFAAIGAGTLVSPASHAAQIAPATAKLAPWSQGKFYGLGLFAIDGWLVQNPSFSGYAASVAYLPSRKLVIGTSVTINDRNTAEDNLSTDVLKDIAAYLAPEAPL